MLLNPSWSGSFIPIVMVSDQTGGKDGLRRVDKVLKEGYLWVVDADIKSYFEHNCRTDSCVEVEQYIADGRVLTLLEKYLQQDIMMA